MTDDAFVTSFRVRDATTINGKTQNYVGGIFPKKICHVFRFLPARSCDMTYHLNSDRQFSSPRFRPCCKGRKQRSADWSKRHRISETWFAMLGVRLSNTSWSSVRHCGAISLKIMSFVDCLCLTLSVCVRQWQKTQSKFNNFGVYFLFGLAKDGHSRSGEMFIVGKIDFWTLINMQIWEVSVLGTIFEIFGLLND